MTRSFSRVRPAKQSVVRRNVDDLPALVVQPERDSESNLRRDQMNTRKIIALLLGVAFTNCIIEAQAQSFVATYDFLLSGTTTGTTDPTPPPTAVGVSFGSFSSVGYTPANPNATNRFSWTSNPTGGV